MRALWPSTAGFATDPDYARKIVMIRAVAIIAIVVLIFLGFLTHMQGNPTLGYMDHAMALILALLLTYLHVSKQYLRTALLGMTLMGLYFVYLFVTGGEDSTGHVWYYTFPLFAVFLLGWRLGLRASLGLLLPAIAFLLAQEHLPAEWQQYHQDFILRFLPSYLVVVAYSCLFEHLRQISHAKSQRNTKALEQANSELRQEIAERKKAQQKMEQAHRAAEKANRAKSDFLANMSHELRTPLNHIIGFTELLGEKRIGTLNTTQTEYLGDVLHSGKQLLFLVNDILDLSTVEVGKLKLQYGSVSLKALLEESLQAIRARAQQHGVDVQLHAENLPETLSADRRRLKQMFYNLLSNAVKFTPSGGQIQVMARAHMDADMGVETVDIGVSDTGIGIQPEDMERIFTPFEQADNSASRRYQGAGLGLSLTKSLVESHGGRIRVESPGRNQGSRFILTLPVTPPGPITAVKSNRSAPTPG